jgi:hypothetical protein
MYLSKIRLARLNFSDIHFCFWDRAVLLYLIGFGLSQSRTVLAINLERNAGLDEQLDENLNIETIDKATTAIENQSGDSNFELELKEETEGNNDVQQVGDESEQEGEENVNGDQDNGEQASNINKDLQLNKYGDKEFDKD